MLSAVFILVLASSVQASFDVNITSGADFRLVKRRNCQSAGPSIINNQDFNDSFRFSTDSVDWRVTSEPLSDFFSGVDIDAGEGRTVTLLLNARSILEFGIHNVEISLRSEQGQYERKIPLSIEVRSKDHSVGMHVAAVKASVLISPDSVHPSRDFTVAVDLINRNPRDLDDIKVRMTSKTFSADINTSLGPLEKKRLEKTFNLNDPLRPPLSDTLTVEVIYEGSVLKPVITENFRIGEYPDIKQSVTEEKEFMKTVKKITYTNVGNTPDSVKLPELTGESSPWSRPGLVFVRPINFEPGEEVVINPNVSKSFSVSVNYRLLLTIPLLIFIIAGILVINHLMQSPVSVKKSAKVVKSRDRAISSFKVFVNVKNTSQVPYKNITVTDNVLSPARLSPHHDPGSPKPNSTYHDGARSVIKWKIKKLDPLEERDFLV